MAGKQLKNVVFFITIQHSFVHLFIIVGLYLKIIQMPHGAELARLNSEVQHLLTAKDYSNPKIKQNLKACKLAIYRNPNLEHQSQDYLNHALNFSMINLAWVLATRSSKDYQIAINSVKFFYENSFLANKPDQHSRIVAINLLFLLSSNRNEEFYTKLETLTQHDMNDKYVKYVLSLNDAIEEGNYRKVFDLKKINPLEDYFGPFLEHISETIQTEIAKSAERAYSQISVKEALNIFQFSSVEQLKKFVEHYESTLQDHSIRWVVGGEKVTFEKESNKKIKFNSQDLIRTSLHYAIELQKIA